ncbi:hypothetical protein ABZ477_04845 [Microbacterium sp. NPDC019599]|uniref:hypothetical protein n=1 Tax=Microbacterium sp. NPDC019599 TaxID=3154690 RepID=UPI0033CA55D4
MGSKKSLVAGAVVAGVCAGAILVPAIASGASLPTVVSVDVGSPDDTGETPGNGGGKAWGHHKDDPDFPGRGRGLDKDSEDFPGKGKGLDKEKHGKAWGHHKDAPEFPGNNANDSR